MQPSINPANLSPEQKDELIVQLFDQVAKLIAPQMLHYLTNTPIGHFKSFL